MEAKRAWAVFSMIIILADAVMVTILSRFIHELGLLTAIGFVALLAYFYVVYKRYHVEVVPEGDIMQFEDVDDLRILSSIYGLDSTGNKTELRNRLLLFARAHNEDAFVWVAPKTVLFLSTALDLSQASRGESAVQAKSLLGQTLGSSESLPGIENCPVCDAKVPRKGSICRECGADLGFYLALGTSKVGKRVISKKAGEVRRKLRYDVPSLRETR